LPTNPQRKETWEVDFPAVAEAEAEDAFKQLCSANKHDRNQHFCQWSVKAAHIYTFLVTRSP